MEAKDAKNFCESKRQKVEGRIEVFGVGKMVEDDFTCPARLMSFVSEEQIMLSLKKP